VIIGNWGDRATNGVTIKVTYEWRLDGHAVGIKITSPERNVEGLIARKPNTNDVGYIAIDNQGGGAVGKVVHKDHKIIVKLSYTDSEGEEGKLALTHEKTDASSMKLVLSNLSDSGEILDTKREIELVRLK
jgi:hypothetical protein